MKTMKPPLDSSPPRRRLAVVVIGFALFVAGGLGAAVYLWRHDDASPVAPKETPVALQEPKSPVAPKDGPLDAPELKQPSAKKETAHEKKVRAAVENGAAYLKKRLLEGKLPKKPYAAYGFTDLQVGVTALMGY